MYVIFEFEFFVPSFAQVRWIDRCLNNRPIDADNNTEARRARRGRFGRADTALTLCIVLTTFTSFPLWDLRRYIFSLQTVQVVGWWGGGLDEWTARLRATPSVQRWSSGFGSVLYNATVYSFGCFFLLWVAGLSFGRRGFARLHAMNWHFSRFTMCCLTCDICLASWGGSISSMTLVNYEMIMLVINKPLREYRAGTWWHGQPEV